MEMCKVGTKNSTMSFAPRNIRMPPVAVCNAGMLDTTVAMMEYHDRRDTIASMVAVHTSGMLVLQLNTAATLSQEKTTSVPEQDSRRSAAGECVRTAPRQEEAWTWWQEDKERKREEGEGCGTRQEQAGSEALGDRRSNCDAGTTRKRRAGDNGGLAGSSRTPWLCTEVV